MKERKQYTKPESCEVRISSLLNNEYGDDQGLVNTSGGSTPIDASLGQAREYSFFEYDVFEEEEEDVNNR